MYSDEKSITTNEHAVSCISIELACPSALPDQLITQLKEWNIRDIFISDDVLDNRSFQDAFKNGKLDEFNPSFNFSLDIKSYLADHPDLSSQILRKRLFSGTQYFIRQKSWGSDIFHFFSLKPEVIPLHSGKKKLTISKPDHIFRLFFTSSFPGDQDIQLQDVTETYDARTNTIKPIEKDGFIIVIRHFSLTNGEDLNTCFNYYETTHLERLLKIFLTRLKSRLGSSQNLVFDFDTLFAPRFDKQIIDYHEKLGTVNEALLADTIRYWLTPTNEFTAYGKTFNDYYQTGLKPVLDDCANTVQYKISVSSPIISSLNLDKSSLLQIDEKLFEYNTPYYNHALIQLKRMESRMLSQGVKKVAVSMHNLLNLHYSFSEKLGQLNHLLAFGANHFQFKYDLTDNLTALLSATDPSYPAYSNWFSRLQQVGRFFKEGIPQTEILVLYPGLDNNQDMFYSSMAQLHQTGLDYTLLDFDLFNSDEICNIEAGQMLFAGQKFKILLLPAIHVLPMDTLKKLSAFLEDGGIIISIGRVPERCEEREQELEFIKLNHNLWFEGNRTRSTSFKENIAGGTSYFQADSSQFPNIITDFYKHLAVEIHASHTGVRYRLRETDNHYTLFLTNLHSTQTIDFEFIGKLKGCPYIWNFTKSTTEPFTNWFSEEERLYIKCSLPPGQAEIFLINKLETEQQWQIIKSSLNGVIVEEQPDSSIIFSGHQRPPGRSDSIIKKEEQTRHIPVHIPGKLPILTVSSRDWYLESDNFKGVVDLGNYARFFPFRSGSLMYHKIIIIEELYLQKQRLKLSLGDLKDWCSLFINEELISDKYESPWEFDITDYIKPGENKLSIKITNTLSNRLAKEDDNYNVRDYGLYGPVKIIPSTIVSYQL